MFTFLIKGIVNPFPHGGALGELWNMSFLLSVHLKVVSVSEGVFLLSQMEWIMMLWP